LAGEGDQEDKTEAGTAKRMEKLREQGSAPVSRELGGLASLGGAALALAMVGPESARVLTGRLAALMERAHAIPPVAALREAAAAVLLASAPVVLAAAAGAVAASLLQTGFRLGGLKFAMNRLNPLAGAKRVLGPGGLKELGRSLLRLAALGWAVWHTLSVDWPGWKTAMLQPPEMLGILLGRTILHLLLPVLGVQAALAGLDVILARRKFARQGRMTREEIREEHKDRGQGHGGGDKPDALRRRAEL
jgi:flagellar biosynthetic protein FlhB